MKNKKRKLVLKYKDPFNKVKGEVTFSPGTTWIDILKETLDFLTWTNGPGFVISERVKRKIVEAIEQIQEEDLLRRRKKEEQRAEKELKKMATEAKREYMQELMEKVLSYGKGPEALEKLKEGGLVEILEPKEPNNLHWVVLSKYQEVAGGGFGLEKAFEDFLLGCETCLECLRVGEDYFSETPVL